MEGQCMQLSDVVAAISAGVVDPKCPQPMCVHGVTLLTIEARLGKDYSGWTKVVKLFQLVSTFLEILYFGSSIQDFQSFGMPSY